MKGEFLFIKGYVISPIKERWDYVSMNGCFPFLDCEKSFTVNGVKIVVDSDKERQEIIEQIKNGERAIDESRA